jgi:hypothetical protein
MLLALNVRDGLPEGHHDAIGAFPMEDISVTQHEGGKTNPHICMTISFVRNSPAKKLERFLAWGKSEGLAILVLALIVVYFLCASWRKWPDPLVDSGHQWYAAWRLSQGALLYHDVSWYYGPLSAYFNAGLFRCFGTGMMVLVAANLVIYCLILALAYAAFRIAWGRMGAFVASAVFISVFSFSRLEPMGNFNYVTPYAHECTHGVLLILVTAFIAVWWCLKPSRTSAFFLGLCGGLAAVIKPEFMLAGGIMGMAAWLLRWMYRQRVRVGEYALILAGLALPTLAFTTWFARAESWKEAFIDASQAWWLVLVDQIQSGSVLMKNCAGFDHPWENAVTELYATFAAVMVMGGLWTAGWFLNRPSSLTRQVAGVVAIGVLVLIWFFPAEGGFEKSLPGLTGIVLILVILRLRRERRLGGKANLRTVMALMLVLLAGALLVRMPLNAQVNGFGFYQAAVAGMVVAAALVTEMPRWTGVSVTGRRLALFGCLLMVAVYCLAVASASRDYRLLQTEPVGSGMDRFYALDPSVEETGALVNWAVQRMESVPPPSTILVLPEGIVINYLSRHVNPLPICSFVDATEIQKQRIMNLLHQSPPDYVILISRSLSEFGIQQYGSPGTLGHTILKWVLENYGMDASMGGDPLATNGAKGVAILRRNTSASGGTESPPIL